MLPRTATVARFVVSLAICAAVSSSARAADPADPAGYRDAVRVGNLEYGNERFLEARGHYRRADVIFANARTQWALGLSEFQLENYVEAITYFEAALNHPVRPLDPTLREDVTNMLARAKALIGHFVIEARPQVSRLLINGNPRELPKNSTLTLQIGNHELQLYSGDYAPERRVLSVKGGEREILHIVFAKPALPIDPGPRWYQTSWFWGAVGVVAAGAVVGIVVAANSGSGKPDDGLVTIQAK